MDRYKKLLNETICFEGNISGDAFTELSNYLVKALPQKLYRYRKCNELSIEAFYRDELYFSPGSVMNDDYDIRIYYNKKEIKERFIKDVNSAEIQLTLYKQGATIPDNLLKALGINMTMDEATIENMIAFMKYFVMDIENNLDECLKEISGIIQDNIRIACFSPVNNSDMMWGNYSSNAEGFALEYVFHNYRIDFGINSDGNSAVCNMFPVLYGDERFDGTNYAYYMLKNKIIISVLAKYDKSFLANAICNIVNPCPDIFAPTKIALNKSDEWRAEKEWRMFYISGNKERFPKVKVKPTALYLGRKIRFINEKVLIDIAREKDIPIYKMYIDENSRQYKLLCELI